MTGRDDRLEEYEQKIAQRIEKYPSYIKNFNLYLKSKKETRTRFAYIGYVTRFVDFIKKAPEEYEMNDFLSFLDSCSKNKDGRPTSGSYRVAIYHGLSNYSKYLFISGLIPKDWMKDVERPKEKPSNQVKRIELSEEDITNYLFRARLGFTKKGRVQWINRIRNFAIIYLLLTTGLREFAVSCANISDFDPDNNVLRVIEKGNKYRECYLSERATEEICSWLIFRKEYWKDDCEALFVSKRNGLEVGRITEQQINSIVKKYSDDFDGMKITPHKLRAFYAQTLYRETKDIYFVQDCMGHASPTTTEIYVKASKTNTKRASEILTDIF